jgi:hypothetical protein
MIKKSYNLKTSIYDFTILKKVELVYAKIFNRIINNNFTTKQLFKLTKKPINHDVKIKICNSRIANN